MIRIKNSEIKVKCMGCKETHYIKTKLRSTEREQRNIDYEYFHQYHGEKCCKCGEKLLVEVDVYEYPQGFLGYNEDRGENCVILSEDYFEITDEKPKLVKSVISDYLDKVADEIPLETKIGIPVEMFMMNLLVELGYREDKAWTDSEEDILEMRKLREVSGKLTKTIMKTIEDC